jgi:uncharacterized membrane protein
MNPETSARLLVLMPIALIGLILPWLGHTRRGIVFGVTVPVEFAGSAEGRRLLSGYRLRVIALVLATLAISAVMLWFAPTDSLAEGLVSPIAVLLELGGNFLLWRHQAVLTKPHATTVPMERLGDLTPVSATGPMATTVLALLPLAATAFWLRLHWDRIPARWPSHWNDSGIVDGWGTRSAAVVYGPLLYGAVFVLIFCAMLTFMARASGPQAAQRRRALVPMAALAWLITTLFCLIGLSPILHLSASQFIAAIAGYLVLVAAVTFWLLRRGGLILNAPSVEPYDSTPDSRWHGGILYYNPADAAVIVPKRFGLGWTLNFARAAAWVYLGGVVAVLILAAVFTRWIK